MDKSNIQIPNQNKNVTLLGNSTRKNKPPVVVRQTKASKLRAEQGNQLEYYKKQVEKYGTDLGSSKEKLTFKMPLSAAQVQTPSVSQLHNNSTITKSVKATKSTVKLNQTALLRAKANEKKMNKTTNPPKSQVKIKNTPAVPNSISNNKKIEKEQHHKSSLRKSISARHLANCNPTTAINQRTCPRRSVSWTSDLQPQMLFKTPTLAKRRSIITHNSTPLNTPANVHLIPNSSPCHDLRKRLSLWLEKQGKPFGAYHHLRCFGLHKPTQVIDEEDKENCVLEAMKLSDSYEQLHIEDVSVANDALFDLHKLIQEGYPRDQCEAWLQHISNNYQQVEDKPQYWECRAALQEALGDLTTALDCYKTAIIKGAEVKQVDESLENLFKKFSVLNISPHLQPKAVNQSKARIIVDARNIFKSQIINFAIKERSKKHNQKDDDTEKCNLIATPVRRSTRSSRSCYKTTPGIQVVPTLTELGSHVEFVTNKALK